jgi:tetratricopeptide (TPR) repeat protein
VPSYSVRDVERVLQLSPAVTRSLIRAGFVNPERGPRREFRFSFQDLIVLRTARALMQAKISAKRIRRSLESLRRELPEALPLSGIAISALGDRVVVRDGDARWQVDSGQYVLGLDVTLQDGVLHVVEHREEPARPEAVSQDWFSQGLALENSDPDAALNAYRQAVAAEPDNAPAWTNWGRLLHESGRTQEAADVYQRARQSAGRDSLLLFNHGVLLEDLGDAAAALQAYQSALEEDPEFADCHYNLARLYESMGKPQHAIRHLGQYRRLVSNETR